MRAALARMAPRERRASSYGVFNAGFGLALFLGSALMGLLNDRSIVALVAFSIAVQVLSVPLLLRVARWRRGDA